MTDRELLELAAKAAGIIVEPDGRFQFPHGLWNPLTDDGDALRLAVKLGMRVSCDQYGDTSVTVEYGELMDVIAHELTGTNAYDATRRAIVRAAAEIGKSMK